MHGLQVTLVDWIVGTEEFTAMLKSDKNAMDTNIAATMRNLLAAVATEGAPSFVAPPSFMASDKKHH
jgi:hypothetical protein